MGLVGFAPPADGHRRRASRHYAALGEPLIRPQGHHYDMMGGRIDEEPDIAQYMEFRRMRDSMLREQATALRSLPEEPEPEVRQRTESIRPRGGSFPAQPPPVLPPRPPGSHASAPFRPPVLRTSQESARPPSSPTSPTTPYRLNGANAAVITLGRPTPLRSTILASRQARGRHVSGSRDHPLVVLSDSD